MISSENGDVNVCFSVFVDGASWIERFILVVFVSPAWRSLCRLVRLCCGWWSHVRRHRAIWSLRIRISRWVRVAHGISAHRIATHWVANWHANVILTVVGQDARFGVVILVDVVVLLNEIVESWRQSCDFYFDCWRSLGGFFPAFVARSCF